jgi:hypothetical protein
MRLLAVKFPQGALAAWTPSTSSFPSAVDRSRALVRAAASGKCRSMASFRAGSLSCPLPITLHGT